MKRLITKKPKERNIGITIYFDDEEKEILKEYCQQKEISYSAYVRLLIRKELNIKND